MEKEKQWLLAEKHQGVESAAFYADCERLAAGTPLAYVIGYIPFLNCKILLDSHPLIPRPETEYWVEKAITEIKNYVAVYVDTYVDKSVKILDLCAGSGAIGVAVAKAIPEVDVTFAEIDPIHLPTIKKNLSENTTIYSSVLAKGEIGTIDDDFQYDCNKYQIVESNVFENVTGKFAFILSNPPYIDPNLDRVELSVRDHEPKLALYGGTAGLEIIERIITSAANYLQPKGQLWLEHEPEQTADIKSFGETNQFSATTYQDQYGIDRYSVLKLSV